MAVGLVLATGLIVLGVGTALRQRETAVRLRVDRFLPSDERAYLRGQVRRRRAIAAVLVVIGGMIGGAFLSGMEARATAIAERQQARAAAAPGAVAAAAVHPLPAVTAAAAGHLPPPPSEGDARFVKFWGGYWIGVLVLVFVAVCLAVWDFWATRKYWMAQYRLIRNEHEAKLRRDLAVYRQTKENDRMTRLGRKKGEDDTPPTE